MTQHTESEWKADYYEGHTAFATPYDGNDYTFRMEFSKNVTEAGKQEITALIAAAPKLLLSAQLEMLFPFQTEEQRDRGWSFARSMGWKEDRPIAHFADEYRKDAIAAAKGNA